MPAKRTGKASSRQSRQRRQQQRSSQRAPLQRPSDAPATDAAAVTPAAPTTPAVVSAPAAASGTSTPKAARPASKFAGLYGSSRLSEQAHLEYHYVERDLRNIGVLVAVMLVLLIVAAIVLNTIGIGPR